MTHQLITTRYCSCLVDQLLLITSCFYSQSADQLVTALPTSRVMTWTVSQRETAVCWRGNKHTHTHSTGRSCLFDCGSRGRVGQSISCLERFRRGLRIFLLTFGGLRLWLECFLREDYRVCTDYIFVWNIISNIATYWEWNNDDVIHIVTIVFLTIIYTLSKMLWSAAYHKNQAVQPTNFTHSSSYIIRVV